MLRGYLVSKACKNKIPTAMPMFSRMIFSMAIIFTSMGVDPYGTGGTCPPNIYEGGDIHGNVPPIF